VADGGHDDDRVDDVRGPGGGTGDASGTAGGLVAGEDVAGLEYLGDLVQSRSGSVLTPRARSAICAQKRFRSARRIVCHGADRPLFNSVC
jgi:hypothetical protein